MIVSRTGRREALLIATGAYDSPALRPLRSPRQDCEGLAMSLGDPLIGNFHVQQLVDGRSYEVKRTLEQFFRNRSRDDLLLLHLSCHGIKDDEGDLHFATRDTDKDLPASTAVPASFLRQQMARCRARTIVVLLDCCYSGAFLPGAKGDDFVHVKEELAGHGRVVLTATNRTEYAWEGHQLKTAAPQPSRFTGALIEGLRSGAADADGDGRITITELYDYVYEQLHHSGARQTPRMWADLEYRVTIAAVRRVEDTHTPPLRPRGRRGQDSMIRLELELSEAAFGGTKDLSVDMLTVCDDCHGACAAPGTQTYRCHPCEGKGERTVERSGAVIRCAVCGGAGVAIPSPCPACAGDGRVRSRRTLKVKIPGGVETGCRIQLAGEGEVGPFGGPAADLYLEVDELPHPELKRRGDDLHVTRSVPKALARSGGTIVVPTLDGPKTVRVPAGLRSGQILRLADLGVMHLRGGGRGALLIHMYPA